MLNSKKFPTIKKKTKKLIVFANFFNYYGLYNQKEVNKMRFIIILVNLLLNFVLEVIKEDWKVLDRKSVV